MAITSKFNDPGTTSTFKAFDPNGKFRERVRLTPEKRAYYEERGWTFERVFSSGKRI